MSARLPRVRPGDVIEARHRNELLDAFERGRVEVGPGSNLSYSEGGGLRANLKEGLWVKLTSNSGAAYAWTEQVRAAGAWADGPRSGTTGTDPATEVNGNAALTLPLKVWAWYEADQQLWFLASTC